MIQGFKVIGIATRTTNANGQSAVDIEDLWQKFWNEKIQDQIPNKINQDIYAIYTDYETDFTGSYTTIIGSAVQHLKTIPEGMISLEIATANYHKIISKGNMPEAIGNTWLEIWGNKDLDAQRAYIADFTIHGEKYYHGEEAEVDTYLSVK